MKRGLCTCVLTALLLSALSGCTSIFEKEYLSASDYVSNEPAENSEGAIDVKTYLGLRIALTRLVDSHGEECVLDFRDYDGSISDDLAIACKEAGTDSALGAYSVDYIAYDLDRIVAYYEARVYVAYKRTAEEVDAVENVSSASALRTRIGRMIEEGRSSLAVMISSSELGERDVVKLAYEAYRKHPLLSVSEPVITVSMYSGSGRQKIFSIDLKYDSPAELIASRRAILLDKAGELASGAGSLRSGLDALQVLNALVGVCVYDENGGSTAWAALETGAADSQGIALAYMALCELAGIECQVVEGRMDRQPHYWNIVTLGDDSYHVDVSQTALVGITFSFLRSDADQWGEYWWDFEACPRCEGPLSYITLIEPKQTT